MSSETVIVSRCARHFAGSGYVVTTEVPIGRKVADLYCVNRATGECVAVEAKMRGWAKAIAQALIYQLGADLVYVAMPDEVARRVPHHKLATHGIGLLAIDSAGKVRKLVAARQSSVRRRFMVEKAMTAVGSKVGVASLSV